jgi:hypothetical protein
MMLPLNFFSAAFLDDSALVAYRLGERLSESCFLTGLSMIFGLGGLNITKDARVSPWVSVQQ